MSLRKLCHIVPRDVPWVGLRADKLVQTMCELPRSQIIGLFDHGCVRVNGALCIFPGLRAVTGDQVQLEYDPARRYHSIPRQRQRWGFDLVFEDRYLLVVQKPADVLTIPTRREEKDTLLGRVAKYVRQAGDRHQKGPALTETPSVFTAHRLDREVSGLLVMGRTEPLAKALRDQFAARKPERTYTAIVAGVMGSDEGKFDSLLATDRDLNRFSTADEEIGQRAVTHYRVLRRLADSTLVQIWLETGRRNQIRVQFADAGHPVVGDVRYGERQAAHRRWPYRRIALHARQLGFIHPVTRKHLKFVSPLPVEMDQFLLDEIESSD
ncbi:MAG: RluA family pseudouridine synthase [Pirellulales bacterium]